MNRPAFNIWFRDQLRMRGWNGAMAAVKIGVQEGTISKWKRRKTPPEMKGIVAIARAFDMRVEDVVAVAHNVTESTSDADRADRRLNAAPQRSGSDEIMERLARLSPALQDALLSVIEKLPDETADQSNRQ